MTELEFALGWPPVYTLLAAPVLRYPAYRCLAAAGGGVVIAAIFTLSWAYAAGGAAWIGVAVVVWWQGRRKDRRRALKAAGARALARIAAMKKTMREKAKPRPVFRPQPQGAA